MRRSRTAACCALATIVVGAGIAVSGSRAEAVSAADAAVGGTTVAPNTWSWQAALLTAPTSPGQSAGPRLLCGGSLVAPTVVLTAAHCLYGQSGRVRAASTLTVITGRTRLSSHVGQEIPVSAYLLPFDKRGLGLFDYATRRWDVAIVELAAPSLATPIGLAGSNERQLWRSGRTAYLAGWGELGAGRPSPDALRVVSVPLLADARCASAYPGEFYNDVMLCAGSRGHDACSRDSGGPLVVAAGHQQFRLVGDISWGYDPCGRKPGVYGRLAAEPVRSVLRRMVIAASGVDIVATRFQTGRRPR